MGAALYIVLKKKVRWDTLVNGKALSHHEEALDRLAKTLGVTPLMDFFSTDPDDPPEGCEDVEVTWQEEWFTPAQGLQTVQALQSHLKDHQIKGIDSDRVLSDLNEFEVVLTKAKAGNIPWHLAVDY